MADFTIDFSAVAVAVIGGVFTVIQAYANAQINKLDTDKQSAAVLEAAMKNSLGAGRSPREQGSPSCVSGGGSGRRSIPA